MSAFIKVARPNFRSIQKDSMLQLNHKEFIIADKKNAIRKYNTSTNKWSICYRAKTNILEQGVCNQITVDRTNNIIYVLTKGGLCCIDLNEPSERLLRVLPFIFRNYGCPVVFSKEDNRIYLAQDAGEEGYLDVNNDYVMEEEEMIPDDNRTPKFAALLDKHKSILIMSHMYHMYLCNHELGSVTTYKLKDGSIKTIAESAVYGVSNENSGYVISAFEDYLVTFGGQENNPDDYSSGDDLTDEYSRGVSSSVSLGGVGNGNVPIKEDEIIIHSLGDAAIMYCKMRLPVASGYHTVNMTFTQAELTLIATKYIEECYKDKKYAGMMLLPVYLIKIISNTYLNIEWVHLISMDLQHHFRVNMDDIINARSTVYHTAISQAPLETCVTCDDQGRDCHICSVPFGYSCTKKDCNNFVCSRCIEQYQQGHFEDLENGTVAHQNQVMQGGNYVCEDCIRGLFG